MIVYLHPNISKGNSHSKVVIEMMDVISFFDGGDSLQEITFKANLPLRTVKEIFEKFQDAGWLNCNGTEQIKKVIPKSHSLVLCLAENTKYLISFSRFNFR